MEARVTALEEGFKEIKADFKSLRTDVSGIKEKLAGIEGKLSNLPTTFQMMGWFVATSLGIAGLVSVIAFAVVRALK